MKLPYSGRCHAEPVPGAKALECNNVFINYGDTPIITGATISVAPGEAVALIGANGSGKSTLLKALVGLLRIERGTVSIFGNQIGACHHRVSYLAQNAEIDWSFPISALDFVATGRYVHHGWVSQNSDADRKLCIEALATVDLTSFADKPIATLSGGQRRRVLFARALVQGGDLFLLDEPGDAADTESRNRISKIIKEYAALGKSFLVVTHDLVHLEQTFSKVLFLDEGVISERAPSGIHTPHTGCC